MAERRTLVDGLKTTAADPTREKAFVYGPPAEASAPTPPVPAPESREGNAPTASPTGRVPLTTRIRADYAAALKRASLERQLSGTKPNTLQDILEAALEPWLQANGYLTHPHR